MPLESLPDRLDDATHQKLDRAVEKAVEDDLGDVSDLSSNLEICHLLDAIIKHSNGDLDTNYCSNQEAKILFSTHGELPGMLAAAWKRKSYREIRNLAILKATELPAPTPIAVNGTSADLRQNLSGSFEATYHGAAVDGFYEYLTHNEKLFKTVDNPRYYAKFCSIVQSSGTGKSRMLTELSKKDVIVIYMNLRGENDNLGFPPRDPIPSRILTQFPPTEAGYRIVCYAFFTAVFETLDEHLSKSYPTRNAKAGIMHWVRQMCDMSDPPRLTARAGFFRTIAEKYEKAHADLVRALNRRRAATSEASSMPDVDETSNMTTAADVDKTVDKLGKLSLSEPNVSDFTARLFSAYRKMAASLERVFADDSNKPKLVIALDEAHPLTPVQPGQKEYRPADVFCRVVNGYSHHRNHAVWVVFASTTSKVADFSPPNQKHNSDRVAIMGEKLFPPYTQLGWDQSAWGLGDIDFEHVSQIDHIAGYGRPLWLSLKTALTYPERVLGTASSKLCGGYDFDARKTNHVLAVLGQRFGLNVTFGHPDSVEHLENGVASHLRICLATTLDRSWRFTSYPSEPLLSCVAAMHLHEKPEKLELALGTLLAAVNSGMIDMGQRGELASRLLWLLAKDLFIRTQAKSVDIPSTWEEHLVDCQMISVVDWFEFIFGPQIWDEEDMQTSLARKSFENAYLNFSHWVCMDAYIAGSKEGNELSLDEWTIRHWQRTSAVQCCHQQPRIDKVIPIYFKGGPENASAKSRMSQIFISDKARESTDSKDVLRSITRRHKNVSGECTKQSSLDSESLPYIAILADLGQPSSFSATFPERDVDDRCLRIYAAGVDTTTYAFLAKYPSLMRTLQNLVHIQQIPETERAYTEYLNAQVKFGSTATAEHMIWERGKNVPNVPVGRKPAGRS